jgi:hypothetical protein
MGRFEIGSIDKTHLLQWKKPVKETEGTAD